MSDVFISHVEEDADIALEIALGLEEVGYSTWCYEIDSIPGTSYLVETGKAVENSKVAIVVISPHSLGSRQVTREVVRAHETGKEFIPVRRDVSHIEFQNRQPEWREAIGAATSIGIPKEGVANILPRIMAGLKALRIQPATKPDSIKLKQIHEMLGELLVPAKSPEYEHVPMQAATEKAKLTTSIERPREAVKSMTNRWWFLAAIVVLCLGVLIILVGTIGYPMLNAPMTPFVPPVEPEATPSLGKSDNHNQVVTFPDANLEAAIREALLKPIGDIYASELVSLTNLSAENRGISKLTGLERCTNLQELILSSNQISDLTPLAGITSLQRLILPGNQISDLTPLAGMTSLQELILSSNQISDLTPLAGMTSLQRLTLDYNQISDLSPLAGLTSLNDLLLSANHIRDVAPLASLTSLTTLWLDHNQISELSPLSSLNNLNDLLLNNNQIRDVAPLASLTNLATLWLGYNQISELSPLSSLNNLNNLLLTSNQISDITSLISLTSLTDLELSGNQITDIAPLVNNTGLDTGDGVNLTFNPLSTTSINVHIPTIQSRGVTVLWGE